MTTYLRTFSVYQFEASIEELQALRTLLDVGVSKDTLKKLGLQSMLFAIADKLRADEKFVFGTKAELDPWTEHGQTEEKK